MSNWATKEFTTEEVAYLKSKGWDRFDDNPHRATDGGWKRIIKRSDTEFEIESYMDDTDGYSWWSSENTWPTLKEALENV